MSMFSRREAMGLLGAATAMSGTGVRAQNVKKIGFILNGTPGDVGWNHEHQRGIDMAKAVFGSSIQVDTFYGVGEWGNGDREKLAEMATEGYDMVFACSFGYAEAVLAASFTAPNTRFEHCGGYVRTGNLSTYSARWYEGRVPQGLIAGAVTKTNKVGYLGSFQIPQVLRGINAAYLAAKSVNPRVEFDVVWVNSWFSPEDEEGVTRLLAATGADVFMAHTNSTKPVEVAEELGLHAFGQASDMSAYGPNAVLTSSINNWGPYYVDRIFAMLADEWQSGDTWGGYSQSMITLGDVSDAVPAEAKAAVLEAASQMAHNQHDPFVGPIRRQDGSTWLEADQVASDADLETMGFYVEGITGQLG